MRLNTSVLPLASVILSPVCGHRSDGVTPGDSVSRPLTLLASLQTASGESDAATTLSL